MKRENTLKYCILLILIFISVSCSSDNNTKPIVTKFTIEEITPFDKDMSYYKIIPISNGGLNVSANWIVDIKGKYNAGDTVVFCSLKSNWIKLRINKRV